MMVFFTFNSQADELPLLGASPDGLIRYEDGR